MCLCTCVTGMCVFAGDRHICVFGGQRWHARVFLNCFLLKFFETGSLTESRTYHSSYTSWPMSFRDLSASTLPVLGLQLCAVMLSFSHVHWDSELRYFLMLVYQAVFPVQTFKLLIYIFNFRKKYTNIIPIFKSPTYFITSILALFLIQLWSVCYVGFYTLLGIFSNN